MTNWLESVYEHIDSRFESEHMPKILRLVRQPSVAGTGEGIEECAAQVMELLNGIGCTDVHLERYVKSPVVVGRLAGDPLVQERSRRFGLPGGSKGAGQLRHRKGLRLAHFPGHRPGISVYAAVPHPLCLLRAWAGRTNPRSQRIPHREGPAR